MNRVRVELVVLAAIAVLVGGICTVLIWRGINELASTGFRDALLVLVGSLATVIVPSVFKSQENGIVVESQPPPEDTEAPPQTPGG